MVLGNFLLHEATTAKLLRSFVDAAAVTASSNGAEANIMAIVFR